MTSCQSSRLQWFAVACLLHRSCLGTGLSSWTLALWDCSVVAVRHWLQLRTWFWSLDQDFYASSSRPFHHCIPAVWPTFSDCSTPCLPSGSLAAWYLLNRRHESCHGRPRVSSLFGWREDCQYLYCRGHLWLGILRLWFDLNWAQAFQPSTTFLRKLLC